MPSAESVLLGKNKVKSIENEVDRGEMISPPNFKEEADGTD
jgi:hypothetical protein